MAKTIPYIPAQPYLAIFDVNNVPILNPLTGIPLGAYITKFNFKYIEGKENQATFTIESGNPDTTAIQELQPGKVIHLQWGYIYPTGKTISSPVRSIKIQDHNAVFDSQGTHITLKCVDSIVALRGLPGFTPTGEEEDAKGLSMVDFMNKGCNVGLGIVIQKYPLSSNG